MLLINALWLQYSLTLNLEQSESNRRSMKNLAVLSTVLIQSDFNKDVQQKQSLKKSEIDKNIQMK